jgi:hypothetical protein
MIQTVILRVSGNVDQIIIDDIDENYDLDNFDFEQFKKHFKKIGKGEIERQCEWDLSEEESYTIYGWKEGKENIINKFELPPPEDTDLYFGDILVFRQIKGKISNCSKSDFNDFYETSYGGFEDLGDEDTDDDEDDEDNEYDFNDGFLVPDSEPIEVESSSSSESEFDFEQSTQENDNDEDEEYEEEDEDDEDEEDEEDDEEDEESFEEDEESSEEKIKINKNK